MKSIDYYNSFKYRFTRPIKRIWFKFLLNRDHLILVDNRHRGIGKTYMLIDRAIKDNIPVAVGHHFGGAYIKRYGNPVEIVILRDADFESTIKGKSFPNGILIDQTVDPKFIKILGENRIRIRGGFIFNYGVDYFED